MKLSCSGGNAMIDLDQLLRGSIDLHMHPGPDVVRRRLDALEAARQAQQAGMRAIVIKNHFYPTAPLANLVNKLVPGIEVFGSLCLDYEVGGLNAAAVKNSAELGSKIVWMPTFSAANARKSAGEGEAEGLSILESSGQLRPEIFPILKLIKQYDLVLATGHIPPHEARVLIDEAVKEGLSRLIITHPLEQVMAKQPFTSEDIQHLIQMGAFIELTCTGLLPTGPGNGAIRMVEAIKTMGAGHFVMSTDLGQAFNPTPVEGLRLFMGTLLNKGISREEIEVMVRVNPGKLLGLE
jgi:hypothetical protein